MFGSAAPCVSVPPFVEPAVTPKFGAATETPKFGAATEVDGRAAMINLSNVSLMLLSCKPKEMLLAGFDLLELIAYVHEVLL